MASVEVLVTGQEITVGAAVVKAAAEGAKNIGLDVSVTNAYRGKSDWLCVWGAGSTVKNAAYKKQLASGRHSALWDLSYYGRSKDPTKTYARVSVDHFHPQRMLYKTPADPERWRIHGIPLRDDHDPDGHVVVVGMGPKSRTQFNLYDWELAALRSAKLRFPGKKILYRPKRDTVRLNWEQDSTSPIQAVLKGASLVIARHSNVGVDACIAGIPVETEDGAAAWLYDDCRHPSPEKRLAFLQRLSWWQWKCSEMEDAWRFLLTVTS